jgi:hypothetical protein
MGDWVHGDNGQGEGGGEGDMDKLGYWDIGDMRETMGRGYRDRAGGI